MRISALAQKISENLGISLGKAHVTAFSDGETRVEINENVRGMDVFIIQPTCTPVNVTLMELLIMIDAVRQGVGRPDYGRHSLLRLCAAGQESGAPGADLPPNSSPI